MILYISEVPPFSMMKIMLVITSKEESKSINCSRAPVQANTQFRLNTQDYITTMGEGEIIEGMCYLDPSAHDASLTLRR